MNPNDRYYSFDPKWAEILSSKEMQSVFMQLFFLSFILVVNSRIVEVSLKMQQRTFCSKLKRMVLYHPVLLIVLCFHWAYFKTPFTEQKLQLTLLVSAQPFFFKSRTKV